jgi:hypothetical protein
MSGIASMLQKSTQVGKRSTLREGDRRNMDARNGGPWRNDTSKFVLEVGIVNLGEGINEGGRQSGGHRSRVGHCRRRERSTGECGKPGCEKRIVDMKRAAVEAANSAVSA